MAIENIKSDLKSLIKLYRHLQSLKIGSQSSGSEYLDEKAQIFLKDLLDGASEKVFEAHSEFMAARMNVSEGAHKTLVFSSENSNPKPAKRKRHYKIHPKIGMGRFKSRDTNRDIHERGPNLHCQHRSESSLYQWTGNNQQKLNLKDPFIVNNTQTYDDLADISGDGVAKKAGSGIDREVERKNEVAGSISNHVASTIKIIDSHILALESAVDPIITDPCVANKSGIDDKKSKLLNESACEIKDIARVPQYDRMNNNIVGNEVTEKPTETDSPGNNIGKMETFGKTASTNLSNKLDEDKVENTELKEPLKLDWKKDQVDSKSVKAMVQRIESMSRLSSQNDQTKTHSCRYIHGIRVPVTPLPNRSENEFQDLYSSPQNELNRGKSRSSMSNRTHHRFMVPPILYGNELDQVELKAKRNNKMSNRNKILLEDTSSSSVASSNWTRQKEITSNSDIEEYSQSGTQSNEYVDSTSYLDSENSRFSSGDSNVVISESTEQNSVGRDEDSESISVGSIMNRRSNSIKVKKPTGGFKKLRDKIGLIFHHHHHHHHHHHEGAPHGKSLWKNAGKILRGKGRRSRTEKNVGKRVEKDARSLVSKNQNGHFHDIVKGVWKHVKNSRSSKVSKGDRERHHGGKKGAQKMQWWRMLKQQRAAKKMPRKPKVKVGVGTTKPRLRVLPMLTSEDGEG